MREDTGDETSEVIEVDQDLKIKNLLKEKEVPVEEVIVAVDGTIVSKDQKIGNVEEVRVMQVVAGG